MSKPIVVSSNEWNPNAIKFMPPKVNERGGKQINMINTETKRSMHVSTPLMMTWGITDFVNEAGENDGKFSMALNFPNQEYSKPSTDVFLEKMKAFENKILDMANNRNTLPFKNNSLISEHLVYQEHFKVFNSFNNLIRENATWLRKKSKTI